MSRIEHELALPAQMVISRRLGRFALLAVSILCLLNCFALVSLTALFPARNLIVVSTAMIGVVAASVAIAAGWLAWSPQSGIFRVATVGAAILLSLAFCWIGYELYVMIDNSLFRFGDLIWELIENSFRVIPMIVVAMSLPGFLLRIARDWKVEKLAAPPATMDQTSEPTTGKKGRWLQFAFCLLLLILSATPIVRFNDWTMDAVIMAIGMTTPAMFVVGAVVVFPIVRLILGSRRYLRWSILFVSIATLLVGPGIAMIFFASRQFQYPSAYIGPQIFLASDEFQQTTAFVTAFCITLAAFLVAVRWTGYSLSMPKYVPRRKTTPEKATVHPLDDVE